MGSWLLIYLSSGKNIPIQNAGNLFGIRLNLIVWQSNIAMECGLFRQMIDLVVIFHATLLSYQKYSHYINHITVHITSKSRNCHFLMVRPPIERNIFNTSTKSQETTRVALRNLVEEILLDCCKESEQNQRLGLWDSIRCIGNRCLL